MGTLPIPLELPPMEARLVEAIPREAGWQYEPKWDGFRCLGFCNGDDVRLQSKSGQPLERYFPEIVARLRALNARVVLDGELVVAVGAVLAFDDLMQRIHPAASRVTKLARERPASYLLFDILLDEDGTSLLEAPLHERRSRLERFSASHVPAGDPHLRLSPATRELATVDDWYARVGGALDGVVAKRLDAPYGPGERNAVVKIKAIRSADCIVGGYRVTENDTLGSLLLGLYDDEGRLDYVGFTSGFPRPKSGRSGRACNRYMPSLTLRSTDALRAARAVGTAGSRRSGKPSAPNSCWKFRSTKLRTSDSGTVRARCVGVPTNRPARARSSRFARTTERYLFFRRSSRP